MEEMFFKLMMVNGKQYTALGNSLYRWCVYLVVPYADTNLDDLRSAFKKERSKVYIFIEWYFVEVKRLWGLRDAKRKLCIE